MNLIRNLGDSIHGFLHVTEYQKQSDGTKTPIGPFNLDGYSVSVFKVDNQAMVKVVGATAVIGTGPESVKNKVTFVLPGSLEKADLHFSMQKNTEYRIIASKSDTEIHTLYLETITRQ